MRHHQEVAEIGQTLCRSILSTRFPGVTTIIQEPVLLQEAVLREVVPNVRSLMEHLQADCSNERSAVEPENSERSRMGVRKPPAFLLEIRRVFARKNHG